MGLHQKTGPVIFPLVPQTVAARYKVVGSGFKKEPRSDLSLEQKHVQNFILLVFSDPNVVLNRLLIELADVVRELGRRLQAVFLDFPDQFGVVLLQTVEMRPKCSFKIFVVRHVRTLVYHGLH